MMPKNNEEGDLLPMSSPRVLPTAAPRGHWSHHRLKEGPRYWRAWWTRWSGEGDDVTEVGGFSFEGYFWRKGLGLGFYVSMEDEWSVKAHVGLGRLVQVWVGAERWPLVRRLTKALLPVHGDGYSFRDPRWWKVSLDDGLLSWNFWASDPMGGYGPRGRPPRHREGMFNIKRWVYGSSRYSEEFLESGVIPVVLPEGVYAANYRLVRRTDAWPRLKRPKTMLRGDIEIPGGVYVPGKGENSYDCGDDAKFSMSCPASTAAELVGEFVKSVYATRLRYDGTVDRANREK